MMLPFRTAASTLTIACLLYGCVDSGRRIDGENTDDASQETDGGPLAVQCDLKLDLAAPTEGDSSLSECWGLDGSVEAESDPDDGLQPRTISLVFESAEVDGARCSFSLDLLGVCGVGFLDLAEQPTLPIVQTYSCASTDENLEREFEVSSGFIEITSLVLSDNGNQTAAIELSAVIVGESLSGDVIDGTFSLEADLPLTVVADAECSTWDGDEDGDGHITEHLGGDDCDDKNSEVSPTTLEIPYDDIDQDCSGEDLIDVDSDGYDSDDHGGDDCDDLNELVYPGAPDAVYDGVDQDCDGADDRLWIDLTGGSYHYCGLDSLGAITCWGRPEAYADVPISNGFESVVGGFGHTCVVDSFGLLSCYGENDQLQLEHPQGDIDGLNARDHVTCGVRPGGEPVCWGPDYEGFFQDLPASLNFLAASYNFACGIDAADAISCWGAEDHGKTTAPDGDFAQIALGWVHGCALSPAGDIECWGAADPGYYDEGQANPPLGTFSDIAVGDRHSCALTGAGSAVCWGNNDVDQSSPPTTLFENIVAGRNSNCGITVANKIECWGYNGHGQLDSPGG